MKSFTSFPSNDINFAGKHVLFVEGEPDSIDVTVLDSILNVTVRPLGQCAYVRSVAQAMYLAYPNYYFLVDRDNMSDEEVEGYWKNFPKADTPNLLAWRKKELESYFLDPDYISQSQYFVKTKKADDIRKAVTRAAKPIVYMAAANRVIISVREQLKNKWIEKFSNKLDFATEEMALKNLLAIKEFETQRNKVSRLTDRGWLEQRFKAELKLLIGEELKLTWGQGRWLDLLPAKEMLNTVLGGSLFNVKDRYNKLVTGKSKISEILKDLLKADKKLPPDFLELQELMKKQMRRT